MRTHEAAVTLPVAHVMAATARLRGELRQQLLTEEAPVLPDWTTLRVTPSVERFDDHGRVVYEYRASVKVHQSGGPPDSSSKPRAPE